MDISYLLIQFKHIFWYCGDVFFFLIISVPPIMFHLHRPLTPENLRCSRHEHECLLGGPLVCDPTGQIPWGTWKPMVSQGLVSPFHLWCLMVQLRLSMFFSCEAKLITCGTKTRCCSVPYCVAALRGLRSSMSLRWKHHPLWQQNANPFGHSSGLFCQNHSSKPQQSEFLFHESLTNLRVLILKFHRYLSYLKIYTSPWPWDFTSVQDIFTSGSVKSNSKTSWTDLKTNSWSPSIICFFKKWNI